MSATQADMSNWPKRRTDPFPGPFAFSWPWGHSLAVLDEVAPDVRMINLETSVTRSDEFAPGKGVHYRMNPANLPCLAAARPDVCVLANNHVLDFGRAGLEETLDALAGAGLPTAGAGRDVTEARRPAVVAVAGAGRVLRLRPRRASSGIPASWAATPTAAGVDFMPALSDAAADEVVDRVQQPKRAGDIVVVSIHWGSNWGYDVPAPRSSSPTGWSTAGSTSCTGTPRTTPGRSRSTGASSILYGCGDFIDDYEGIPGHEEFRDDLRLLYFVSVEASTGALVGLRMVPMQARRMRLEPASQADAAWLCGVLDLRSRGLGAPIDLEPDGGLVLRR